jgi:regulator of cell morphogenesis and NO signaling
MKINETSPVGQVARAYPAAVAVFEEFDIDYACAGGRSVAEASKAAGYDPKRVLEALESAAASGPADAESMSELLHRIVTEHHRFESARFKELAARCESPAIANITTGRIRRILLELGTSVSAHMLREERNLFPRIEELELHPHRVRAGSITRPLMTEFVEHDVVHDRLQKIRELSLRLDGIADKELVDDLEELYRAVHRHTHLENNVLIPRVVELENQLKSSRRDEILT